MYRLPLYTVHMKTTHAPLIFHIQHRDTQEYKPFLLSFDRKKSAYIMAKMLEGHKVKHNEWPHMEISPMSSFRIDSNANYEKNALPNLYVRSWTNAETYTEFITQSLLNVMVMSIGDDRKIISSFFQFEYPTEHVRRNLRLD
jgi:hypothetical protein